MSRRLTLEEFVKKSNIIHNDKFDYSISNYINNGVKIEIICPIHGNFSQLPSDHMRGIGCKKCGQEKTGISKRLNNDTFIEKASRVHNNKFDYSKVRYTTSLEKVDIICPEHGIFSQFPNDHLYGKGCRLCKYTNHSMELMDTAESFIEKCKKIHGDRYDYSKVVYKDSKTNVDIICKIHGQFKQSPSNHINNECNCPSCVSPQSKPEKFISEFLTRHNIKFIENDRNVIGPKELDFYIPDHNLAIEFNGIYFHSELTGHKNKNYHLNKTIDCGKSGIRLLHIFETEYTHNRKILLSKLKNIIKLTKYKIFARKCKIKPITTQIKKTFINKYHIQGDCPSSINLGLFYKNRLMQVMTFSKKRISLGSKSNEGEYELARMCSMNNFNIVGGSSKLLAYFEKMYSPKSLLTYADRRWSGPNNVYLKMGFTHTHDSDPNYWYFHKSNFLKHWHRFSFAKHKLENKLKIFDNVLSEWENMKNNNYDRIWDCGNSVYVKTY
jgi:hypothetical protein